MTDSPAKMDPHTIKEDSEASEGQVDGDFYYTKAMNYLAVSSSDNVQSNSESCKYLPCPGSSDDKDDDHFTLGFRRGLTRDQDADLHSSGSSCSSNSSSSGSPRGSDSGISHHSGASTSSPTPTASSVKPASPKRRERKCSIGGRFYKTGGSEFGKIEPKRKMSDGHVHWADEFQKELTRCNPRKSYTRHPSHVSSQVKPILKVTHDDTEES